MASDFLKNRSKSRGKWGRQIFSSSWFWENLKNLKPWPQKRSMTLVIYVQSSVQHISQIDCWYCGRRENEIAVLNKGWHGENLDEFGAWGGHSFASSTNAKKPEGKTMRLVQQRFNFIRKILTQRFGLGHSVHAHGAHAERERDSQQHMSKAPTLVGNYSSFTQSDGQKWLPTQSLTNIYSQILFRIQTYKTTSPVAQGRFQDLSQASALVL